jgi:hypothetical protein
MTRTHRSIGRLRLQAAALGALVLLGGRSAQAQWGQPQNARLVFEWQGEVDRETRINIGQRNVTVRGVYGQESQGRFVNRGSLPTGGGTLYIQRISGRGSVDVIQQPGYNSGDGIIRVADTQGGHDYYDVRVYWQPNGTTAGRNDGTWDRNGNNGTWDRGNGRDNASARGQERRAEAAERQARKFEEKAEKARRKAEEARRKARRHD